MMLKQPDFLPATLLAVSQRLELATGGRLFTLGAPVTQLFWLCRGELQAVRATPAGQESVIMRGRAGEFFAEATLYTPHYTCEAVARKPCVVLAIPIEPLRSTLGTDAKFSEQFLRSTVMSLRRQCSRLERLRLRSASERIQHYLICEATVDGCCQLDMPLSEWAVELGLEPETLYRTLRVLEENGVVVRDKKRMRLCASR
jgi:CRP-like cAMP-binding protein